MQERLSAPEWLVREDRWDPTAAGVRETQFAVGNGRLGTRGTLEEGAPGERSGTFLAGVYDDHGSSVIDLVNAPDWTGCTILVDGTELSVATMEVVSHVRALDLRQALVWRRTVFEDRAGNRTRLESLRFASGADTSTCVQRLEVTPENHDGEISVSTRLDGRRRNLDRLPTYPSGTVHDPEVTWEKWAWTNHLDEVDRLDLDDLCYLEMRTRSSGVRLGYASTTHTEGGVTRRSVVRGASHIAEVHTADVPAGRTLRVDRVVTVVTSRSTPAVRDAAMAGVRSSGRLGVDSLLEAHREAWARRWDDCDCEVVGDPAITRALRFGIYHLLIAADGTDPTVNVGAKSLTGEGYRGHIFWDTEVLLLPFYTFTRPETARTLLRYRHHTLPAARELARADGHRGARYPWESADTGKEECPMWTDDGSFRFWSRDEEIHVSADVAYGVLSYVAATGDEDFLHEYGLEILVETSRFWVDRATPGEGGRLSILQVMGPDEFHSHVDDNAFTNVMAAWCLRAAADSCDRAARLGGDIVTRLAEATGFTADEPAQWREVADRLRVPDPGPGVIEQFSGYFQRRDVPITDWDDNDMPRYPEGYHHFNCESTMLVKQPDVLMLFHLLPDAFDHATKLANFEFYEARTLHKSSLSPAIHAVLGLEVGDARRAMQYFRRSAMVDLDDNQGNTVMGMHIASAAGTWQILVNGFAGFRVLDGTMAFDPRLPPEWDEVRFRLHWRGARLTVTVGHAELGLALDGDDGSPVPVVVRGHELVLAPGAQVVQPLEPGTHRH